MRSLLGLCVLLGVVLGGGEPAQAAWREDDLAALKREGLRVRDREVGAGGEVEAVFFVAAPLAVAREVLWDHRRFPEFLPNTQVCRTLSGDDRSVIVEQIGGQGPFQFRLVTRRQLAPDRITWRRVEGDLRENEGEWRFERVPGGTVITYRCHVEPDVPAPSAVVQYMQRQAVPGLAAAVRARVERQGRAGVSR